MCSVTKSTDKTEREREKEREREWALVPKYELFIDHSENY